MVRRVPAVRYTSIGSILLHTSIHTIIYSGITNIIEEGCASTNSSDLGSWRRPEPIGMKKREAPHVVRPQQCWSSQASSRRGDAREDALRPCLTYRTLLPTTLADTDATCSRCLTLRGEGTRRVTTIPEISLLAQSFPSVVRLQCLDLTRYLSNT